MITDYAGTVILVSHDRDFLDRTVSSVLVSEGGGRWVEYAGGYSDMVAQRGAGVEARPIEKVARPKVRREAIAPEAAARRRLSFNEQHDLKTLPARISALEARIGKLHEILDDHTLYARDKARFDKVSAELAAAQSDLSALEERWLALEILREEVEG